MILEEEAKKKAEERYQLMLDNYLPVPRAFETEKEILVATLRQAFIDGTNWRLQQVILNWPNI